MKNTLTERGSLAFLIAVFLNAFIDLGHKIVIQNTLFKIYEGETLVVLTAILNGLILLPFILLFSPAGFISDKYPKHRVMQITAWTAVLLTNGITVCYALGLFWLAFAMTFLLAAQSAIYSPAKFAYIRGFYGKEKLAEVNGVVAAISIIAILSGTVVYSILFEAVYPQDAQTKSDIVKTLIPIGFILIANSIFELVMTYRLPQKDQPQTQPPFSMKRYLTGKEIGVNLKPALSRDVIRLSIIGLAMFWSIGQILLASFPAFAKEQTGELNTIIIQAILACSGLGIALGSVIASKASKNYIETGLIPVGAAGIAIGLLILPGLTDKSMMALAFLFIGTMGGMFIVPLNAMIQYHAKENEIGRVLAGNNLIQNIAMLSSLILAGMFATLGLSSKQLLMFTALFAIIGGSYTVYKLPQSLLRFLLSYLMRRHYTVEVQGMKNMPNRGGVLLLGNHISWIDWAVVQIACPRPVQFVMARRFYERWYLTWFFKMFGCVPIEQGKSSKSSLITVARLLDDGKVVCLFPEGMISRTGHLAEFRRGFEHALNSCQSEVHVVPFYLRGLWGSQFSYSSERLKKRANTAWKREIIVAFGPPQVKTIKTDELKRRVFDLSVSSWQHHVERLPTLAHAWIDTVKRSKQEFAIADTLAQPLTPAKALSAAIVFSRRIAKLNPAPAVGLLLPTSAGGMLANMAALLLGKTLVNLNYTAAPEAIKSAIDQAQIKTIFTSSRFIKKLQGRGIDLGKTCAGCQVIYLEDLREKMSVFELTCTFFAVKVFPACLLKRFFCREQHNTDVAAILFSSGSEGQPKGVCLTHINFMANLKQISDVLNVQDTDCVMASLPLFHAFGLTVTQFLPLIEDLPVVCHADPTDALGVAKAVAQYRATLLFGTSTFLRLYARSSKVHPLMLESLRLVVAGAERLNPEVRSAFESKFKRSIFEGYGATETTPVASVNLTDSLDISSWRIQLGGKIGTVGMPLPGTSIKIVDPQTWQELPSGDEGMILIGGAQVMKGYLNNEQLTAEAVITLDDTRWYVTGDKGKLDSDGFLTIVDRYSRFAKIGGEMISLSAVEGALIESVKESMAELEVVAVNLPDEKKGEQIVILTLADLRIEDVRRAMIDKGLNPLMIPTRCIQVAQLPKLGSGKTDFAMAKRMALEAAAGSSDEQAAGV